MARFTSVVLMRADGLLLSSLLAFLGLCCLPKLAFGAFGLSTATDYYTIDTGGGLVFKVRRTDNGVSTQSAGDLMSLVYNGVEYQDQSRGSQINSGFDFLYTGVSAVTVSATMVDADSIKVTVAAGDLTHYYMARRGYPQIYMATYFTNEPSTLGLCRYIVRIPSGLLPNGPVPSDIRNTTSTIESGDIFAQADGQTRSKHYSNMRLKDWSYIGATGPNVGVWVVRSTHEGDSGGPFYRSLLNQCGSDQEITYILNYGEGQTEAFRTSILNGPYTLIFTGGGPPPAVDTSWIGGMGLIGYVAPAGRGSVTAPSVAGRDSSYAFTAGFANTNAQYWTDLAGSNGAFNMNGMIPGAYRMSIYKNELVVHTQSVTVVAGSTSVLSSITITNDPSRIIPLWRIGNWDGTPNEFLNADKVTFMHPSDVRMGTWAPGPFLVGSSSPATGMPCYQWKDVNGGQVVQFVLSGSQLVASTIRIGITTAYEGARPKISVNTWSSTNPSPSTQPDSRTLTVGTYRGNNTTYTFAVPASALVAGTNTLTIYPISGSGTTGFLSAGYSLDCIEMYQGAPQSLALPSPPATLTASATNGRVSLSWTLSSGATSYVVRRATNSGGPYAVVGSGITGTNFVETNFASDLYFYVVSGRNSSGTGLTSPEARVVVGVRITPAFIQSGSVWRYFDKTNDLGSSWQSSAFNDANWSNGPARLGFGNDGEVTKVASNRQWTTYFRRSFYVPTPERVSALNARLTRDDAAVLYLNGTEVWRDTNMPSGTISNQTPALSALSGTNETNWLGLALDPSGLVSGWNLVAAEVHQQSLTSSDIGFDFELLGTLIHFGSPILTAASHEGFLTLTWPISASYFRPESALELNPANWVSVTNQPVLTNGAWQLDWLPGGRRYFRLRAP